MDSWKNEVSIAVEAGEREFGPLDAHQTIKRNLMRRCEEIVAEQAPQGLEENQAGAFAAGESD